MLVLRRFRVTSLPLLAALVLASDALAADVSVKLDSGAGFVVKNSGNAERLRFDEATGNVTRNGALFVHTTSGNLFVGEYAGNTTMDFFASLNTGLGRNALRSNTLGFRNTGVGYRSLRYNTEGFHNAALGTETLRFNTTGSYNTALGSEALGGTSFPFNQTGSFNSAVGFAALYRNTSGIRNSAVGHAAMFSNTTGGYNAAVGDSALRANLAGYSNSALGESALRETTTGSQNSASGRSALRSNNIGSLNSAFGSYALRANTSGNGNSGLGQIALRLNTVGSDNVAVGRAALYSNTSGSRNVAVGLSAGNGQTTGDDNVYLASPGVAGESGRIRIGSIGTHTQTVIAGISGATSAGGVAVLVNASGVLGTTTSSARFKQDIHDMGDASGVLMKLRPVVFRYREDAVGAEEAKTTQYGLIAEEVAQVAPELVAPDLEGKPYSVKYHELPALLVNELQQQRQEIAALRARVEELEAR